MKSRGTFLAAGVVAVAAAFAMAPTGATTATQPFGTRETLGDTDSVAAWTVTGLGPSADVIPYRVQGRLYEATATVEAEHGTVTPVIPPFNARTASGQSYPVLAGVASPLGLNPSSLLQGQRSTGKLYFDVVGAAPDSVAYTTGSTDLMLWAATPAPADYPTPTETIDPNPAELPAMPPNPWIPIAPFMPGSPMMPGY